MPNYTYVCCWMHESDLVRPIGTDLVPCPKCGDMARRQTVNHVHVIGPTVNTTRMGTAFRDAVAEREHIYQTAEARVGEPIARPDDWSALEAKTRAKAKRGEIDTAKYRNIEVRAIGGAA